MVLLLRHIPNLDAVRALAILLVMAFHARYLAFGWSGVWIFFVLSGFLITRSLIPLSAGRLRDGLTIFYARRSLRIWPAYYLYILAAALVIVVSPAGNDPARQLWYAAFYVSNLAPLFGASTGGRLFSHLWSLAVEEQYYLVIAPIVLLLGRRRCVPWFIAGVLLSPVIRFLAFQMLQPRYGAASAAELVQMLTPLQLDLFMLGGLLALREDLVVRMSTRTFALAAAGILGLAAVSLGANDWSLMAQGKLGLDRANLDFSDMEQWRLSATSFGISVAARDNMAYVWLYSVIGLASLLLIATVIRLLNGVHIPVLNRIGKVSSGTYLYHMPLVSVFDAVMRRIAVPKHSVLGVLCFVGLVLVTWAIAAASYAWIERPFLRIKDRRFASKRAGGIAELHPARDAASG